MKGRTQYEYIKGNFPVIIPEETWNRVQRLKGKKVTHLDQGISGKKRSKDHWIESLPVNAAGLSININGESTGQGRSAEDIPVGTRSITERKVTEIR